MRSNKAFIGLFSAYMHNVGIIRIYIYPPSPHGLHDFFKISKQVAILDNTM